MGEFIHVTFIINRSARHSNVAKWNFATSIKTSTHSQRYRSFSQGIAECIMHPLKRGRFLIPIPVIAISLNCRASAPSARSIDRDFFHYLSFRTFAQRQIKLHPAPEHQSTKAPEHQSPRAPGDGGARWHAGLDVSISVLLRPYCIDCSPR